MAKKLGKSGQVFSKTGSKAQKEQGNTQTGCESREGKKTKNTSRFKRS
ncbi:hypothetical protein [Dyadobacter sp. NIV53]|nr:hypothetical protein [Dyadobacter sp. NIV53]